MRYSFLLLAFFHTYVIQAQLDTAFYLAPIPEWSNQTQELTISTPFPDATVTIFNSDSSYFNQLVLSQGVPNTVYLNTTAQGLGSTYGAISVNFGNQVIDRAAIFIRSDRDIVLTQRVVHQYNQDLISAKGTRALGLSFLAGNQTKIVNAPPAGEAALGFISFVATENNTAVSVNLPPGITDKLGNNIISCNLNKWESYTITLDEDEQFAGAAIISNKPISVTTGANHVKQNLGGPEQDGGFDQLVPEELVGKEYVIARGLSPATLDYLVIIPTDNNTNIWANGVLSATKNKSEVFEYTLPGGPGSVVQISEIWTDKPVYCFHVTTGSNQSAPELGLSLVPPASCTGSRAVYASRMTGLNTHLLVLVPTSDVGSMRYNGLPISSYNFKSQNHILTTVQNTTSFYIPDASVTNTFSLTCRNQFHVEVIAGLGTATGLCGFYSGFDSGLDILDPYLDVGSSILNFPARCKRPLKGFFGLQTCLPPVEIIKTEIISGQATVSDPNPFDTLIDIIPALGFSGDIWVKLVAIDASGSIDSVLMRMPFYTEGADLLPDTVFGCPGSPATITAPFGMKQYNWNTGETTQTIEYGQSAPLILFATSDSCSFVDTVWVVSKNPIPDILPDTILSCDSIYVISFSPPLGIAPPIDSIFYRSADPLNSGAGNFNVSTGLWEYSVPEPGVYVLEIFDSDNCVTYESVEIKINPHPKYELIYDCPDVTIILKDIISFTPFVIEGNDISVDSATISFPFDGVYNSKIEVIDLCGNQDTIHLSLPYFCAGRDLIWAPNAFTPNDDGLNDEFCLYSSYGKALRYEIYDRWGNLVHIALPEECWSPSKSVTGVYLVRLIYPEIEGRSSKVLQMTLTALP